MYTCFTFIYQICHAQTTLECLHNVGPMAHNLNLYDLAHHESSIAHWKSIQSGISGRSWVWRLRIFFQERANVYLWPICKLVSYYQISFLNVWCITYKTEKNYFWREDIIDFTVPKISRYRGCFPFNQKFKFEISKISSGKCNSILQKLSIWLHQPVLALSIPLKFFENFGPSGLLHFFGICCQMASRTAPQWTTLRASLRASFTCKLLIIMCFYCCT